MRRLAIITLILGACKAYVPPTPIQNEQQEPEANQPDWVSRKPTSESHYIGIGNAPLIDSDHQMSAKLEALDDLASEISVTIESSSLLSQIENSFGFREQFQSAIKSTTKQSVELHEQVASWSDDRFYWVQYRLSKVEFDRQKKSKKEAAVAFSKSHFMNGRTAQENGEIIQALHFYAQSIEAISGYINEPNTIRIGDSYPDIPIEAYANMISILSGISLESDSMTYHLLPHESNKRVTISLLTKSRQPVAGLTIAILGRTPLVTNQKGEVYLDIQAKSVSEKLVARVDMGFLEGYPTTKALLQNVAPAQIQITFLAPAIKMIISSDEQNLGLPINQDMLLPLVKKLLTEKGFHLVDEKSDYYVEIQSNTREGGELSGLYTSYLDFTLDIKTAGGERVYSDSFSNVKGIHTSYQSAGLKAYQNVEKQLYEKLKASLNKNFINKD